MQLLLKILYERKSETELSLNSIFSQLISLKKNYFKFKILDFEKYLSPLLSSFLL